MAISCVASDEDHQRRPLPAASAWTNAVTGCGEQDYPTSGDDRRKHAAAE